MSSRQSKKRRRRKVEKTVTEGESIGVSATQEATISPELESVREEFTKMVFDLMDRANSVALALATVECEDMFDCEVCQTARELVKVIKRMVTFQRKHMARIVRRG
ncbi:MAG: hypothetical protein DRP01_02595 [Archaeoglobales archaeon]|nr:MAG: hypothetical protein DRP01_02595 [Archaeoglobales archaeon]